MQYLASSRIPNFSELARTCSWSSPLKDSRIRMDNIIKGLGQEDTFKIQP